MSGIEQVARAALSGALNSLWISLALAGAAWTLARCLPRTNAATRHLLWWAVLALVLIAPFGVGRRGVVGNTASGPAVTAPRAQATIAPAVFPAPTPPRAIFPLRIPPGRWLRAVMVLWGLFGLGQLLRIAWSFTYLHKVKRAAHAAPEALGERFRYWVAACGIRRPVRLLISRQVASPLATGFRHPAVILPAPLVEQFGERELDHALLHELAHVARRDDWTNLLARGLGAIAGLHPVAAWVLGRIAREREVAADDWVVSRTGEARPYAASLARLFELCRSQRPMVLAAGMADSPSHLGERIEILLDSGRHFSVRASLARVALTAIALLALVAAGARAPRWIVLAQSAPPTPARELPRPASVPVNPHGSFLAALVAAGYGNLSVDEIISLKDHGVDAQFLAGISQSGWERMTARELIELRDHGVPPEMLRALREAGLVHVEIREVVDAFAHGVRPETLREAAQYGSRLSLAQIVRLKQAGVIP
jgi:beta-lactamase regulating signal transducer with metallopeptidase domain